MIHLARPCASRGKRKPWLAGGKPPDQLGVVIAAPVALEAINRALTAVGGPVVDHQNTRRAEA